MEDGRIDRAAFKDYGEIATGSSSTVFTTSAYTVNIENGNTYSLILNDDCSFTFANPTGSGNACSFTMILKQDQVGGWCVAWPTSMRWQSGVVPAPTKYPGDFDVFTFFTVNGGSNWIGVQAARDHINGVGELWTWGRNNYGQLGQNLASTTDVSSPTQIGTNTNWTFVGAGIYHALGIKSDGTLWTWGRNTFGQLGNNNVASRSSPAQVGALTNWKQVSAGFHQSHALKTDGTLWGWGLNSSTGGVGDNTNVQRSSPVQIGTLTSWLQTSSGNAIGFAIRNDGTLWSWGQNANGQLGHNNTTLLSSPAQVGALTNWKQVEAGRYFAVALKTDGTLWTWGQNANGQLGHNNTTLRSSPVQVGALTDWAEIVGGNAHVLALKTDGTLWSWGSNNYGQIGNSSTADISSPIQIGSATTWASASGYTQSFALKTDGTLWGWGINNAGQLGLNVTGSRSSPAQVGTLSNWSSIKSTINSAIALRYPPSFTGPPPDPVTIAFAATATDTTDSATYTFTNHSIGTAATGRIVLVCVSSREGTSFDISSVTIGGTTATQLGSWTASVASNLEFWALQVDTGTTATIVVNFTATANRCAIATYALNNVVSVEAYDSDQSAASGVGSRTATLNTPDGGAIIAFVQQLTNNTVTWSGTAGVTEDWDTVVETNMFSGASATTTLQTNVTAIATFSGSDISYIHAISIR